ESGTVVPQFSRAGCPPRVHHDPRAGIPILRPSPTPKEDHVTIDSSHFTLGGGEPTETGRYVRLDDLARHELIPGLGFQPLTTGRSLLNLVVFEPNAPAPLHHHEEEQVVVILEGELEFNLDGDVRVIRAGDVVVVPSWVP